MDPRFIEQLYEEVADSLSDKQEAFVVGFLSALRSIESGCLGIREELEQAFGVELVERDPGLMNILARDNEEDEDG
jgi:hypothetical protein